MAPRISCLLLLTLLPGIFGRRYDSTGAAVGGEFQVNTVTALTQVSPSVSLDAAGNAVIVWTSEGADGSSSGISARRFDASGAALGVEFGVDTFTAGPQSEPSVATHADGRFVVSWTSFAQDGSGGACSDDVSAPAAPRSAASSR